MDFRWRVKRRSHLTDNYAHITDAEINGYDGPSKDKKTIKKHMIALSKKTYDPRYQKLEEKKKFFETLLTTKVKLHLYQTTPEFRGTPEREDFLKWYQGYKFCSADGCLNERVIDSKFPDPTPISKRSEDASFEVGFGVVWDDGAGWCGQHAEQYEKQRELNYKAFCVRYNNYFLKHTEIQQYLELPRTASDSEIHHRYRQVIKQAHPDHGGDPETFKKIHAAYEKWKMLNRGEVLPRVMDNTQKFKSNHENGDEQLFKQVSVKTQ